MGLIGSTCTALPWTKHTPAPRSYLVSSLGCFSFAALSFAPSWFDIFRFLLRAVRESGSGNQIIRKSNMPSQGRRRLAMGGGTGQGQDPAADAGNSTTLYSHGGGTRTRAGAATRGRASS